MGTSKKMSAKKKDASALLVENGGRPQKNKPKISRDQGCCSINFLKCVLHIFNVVFMVAGVGVLGVAVWTIVARHRYAALLSTPTYVAISYLLAAAGGLAVPLCALGCCGLRKENRTGLLCYAYLLLISFLLEVGAGSLAYYYEVVVESELKADLNATLQRDYFVEPAVTRAVDALQIEFRCCGAERFSEWRRSAWRAAAAATADEPRVVPDSCCQSVTPLCGRRDHPSNIHYAGCVRYLTDHIREQLVILGAVGAGMSVVPIFGFVFACCLYAKIKHVVD